MKIFSRFLCIFCPVDLLFLIFDSMIQFGVLFQKRCEFNFLIELQIKKSFLSRLQNFKIIFSFRQGRSDSLFIQALLYSFKKFFKHITVFIHYQIK